MAGALADVVPLAVGVALSPLAILALLLMLLSDHERANARAFLIGWTAALAGLSTAAVLTGLSFRSADPSTAVRAAMVATGVALVGTAALMWRRRPRAGSEQRASRWLMATDGITPLRAGALAAALVVLNVKDAALTIGAGTAISDAALTTGGTALALGAFTAIASITVVVPAGVALLRGEHAEPTLRRWHGWFERHGTALVAAVLGVAGLLLLGDGLRGG